MVLVSVAARGLPLAAVSGAALPSAAWAPHGSGWSLVHGWHAESSHTRDRARVPCIGRWIIIHRKVLKDMFRFIPFSCRTQEPIS